MANPAFRPGPDSEGLFSRARVFISTNEPWSPASPSLPLWILPLAAPWPCPAASPTRTRDPGALPPLSAASGSGAPLEAPGLWNLRGGPSLSPRPFTVAGNVGCLVSDRVESS
jgi:hypothetical protein